MDSSGEFLFGHNAHTLPAGLPYPSFSVGAPSSCGTSSPSTQFANALASAEHVLFARGSVGPAWPLLREFWIDRIASPMRVIREFLDPLLTGAVDARTVKKGKNEEHFHAHATEREVQEGETLVEHLLNYTDGTLFWMESIMTDGIVDRTILRDEIFNISVAGRDTGAWPLLLFPIYSIHIPADI